MAVIWYIAFVVAVGLAMTKWTAGKRETGKRPDPPSTPWRQTMGPASVQGQRKNLSSARGLAAYEQQKKQQELKQRLKQHYGSASGRDDILSRASANAGNKVSGRTADRGRALAHPVPGSYAAQRSASEPGWQEDGALLPDPLPGAPDFSNASEQMRQVSDLMIMGYQAKMTYERDFIAEGMELLGRYQL